MVMMMMISIIMINDDIDKSDNDDDNNNNKNDSNNNNDNNTNDNNYSITNNTNDNSTNDTTTGITTTNDDNDNDNNNCNGNDNDNDKDNGNDNNNNNNNNDNAQTYPAQGCSRRLNSPASFYYVVQDDMVWCYKNRERHTAHTIVSWPNPKQWAIVHTSDSMMMIIRQSIYMLSIITREMGQLKTHSPTCFVMDNWENVPYLTDTLDKLYLTGILWVQCLKISLHNDDNEMV